MTLPERILVVRRDNIGDLVLTTPLIRALRVARPQAWIGALVNTYNAAVLAGNSDLNAVYAYDKAKHRSDRSRLSVYAATARTLLALRHLDLDHVILAGPAAQRQAWKLVRWIGAKNVIGFTTGDFAPTGITSPMPYGEGAHLHEAEDVFRLLQMLGIGGEVPGCVVRPDARLVELGREEAARALGSHRPWIGVHLSARRVTQRWPVGRFAEAMHSLHRQLGAGFILYWAPGAADDQRHPGDDALAHELRSLLPAGMPVFSLATTRLEQLIAGLSLCDAAMLADGGAMHLAAALGKPVVALFGDSPVSRWRPWRVEHEVVQAASGDVADVPVADVISAWERLLPRVAARQ